MELTQQVKNFTATLHHIAKTKPTFRAEDHTADDHRRALQALSNGHIEVNYDATMRVVLHEGGRQPKLPARVTQKHPGYIRNESGGFFTS